MKLSQIRGYCDRPNVRGGERLDFFLSSPQSGSCKPGLVRLVHGDRNPAGPGYREEPVDCQLPSSCPVGPQFTQMGGHVRVADPDHALSGARGMGLHLHIWPTTPGKRQAVISRFSEFEQTGWALLIENGCLCFITGDGNTTSQVRLTRRLFPEVWYSVAVSLDVASQTVQLSQRVTLNSVNSRFGRMVDIDSDESISASGVVLPGIPTVPLVMAGLCSDSAENCLIDALYNGKIDAPTLYDGDCGFACWRKTLGGACGLGLCGECHSQRGYGRGSRHRYKRPRIPWSMLQPTRPSHDWLELGWRGRALHPLS
jgi:N,N-dimethylformamidase